MMLNKAIKLTAAIGGVVIILGVYVSENKNKEEIINDELEINLKR
ncbi:hypothetical protein ABFP60_05870 [Clostridioides difficile]